MRSNGLVAFAHTRFHMCGVSYCIYPFTDECCGMNEYFRWLSVIVVAEFVFRHDSLENDDDLAAQHIIVL